MKKTAPDQPIKINSFGHIIFISIQQKPKKIIIKLLSNGEYIMPLVAAKCPNCAANLQVNSNNDAAVCEYCKTALIVEKAINNYNITNSNNIKADVVNIFNNNATDFFILAGTLKKYNGAATKVIIPEVVTTIGEHAFEGCSGLTSVLAH